MASPPSRSLPSNALIGGWDDGVFLVDVVVRRIASIVHPGSSEAINAGRTSPASALEAIPFYLMRRSFASVLR
jgi:hypothetical protein